MIKAIIFDCDGTLVDSEIAHYESYRHALARRGVDFPLEEYLLLIGKGDFVCARLLAEQINIDSAEDLLHDKRAHYRTMQEKGHPPIQDTVDFLHRVASEKERRGLKVALASAARKEEILGNLNTLGVEHYFDVILSGEDDLDEYNDPEGVNKPKPYIYQHAAKLLKLFPRECVVIEDTRNGVTAGVDAGCIAVAVPNSFTKHQDLSHAHLKVNSLSDISVDEFLKMAQSK